MFSDDLLGFLFFCFFLGWAGGLIKSNGQICYSPAFQVNGFNLGFLQHAFLSGTQLSKTASYIENNIL